MLTFVYAFKALKKTLENSQNRLWRWKYSCSQTDSQDKKQSGQAKKKVTTMARSLILPALRCYSRRLRFYNLPTERTIFFANAR